MTRSSVSKEAWRIRKRRKSYRGICPLCHKPVWARGLRKKRRMWHNECWIRRASATRAT